MHSKLFILINKKKCIYLFFNNFFVPAFIVSTRTSLAFAGT